MKYEVETDEAIHKWTDKTKKYRSEDTDQRIQIREYRSENTDHRIIKRESSENQARIKREYQQQSLASSQQTGYTGNTLISHYNIH